ncbi:MAG: radical SAM protein [Candidatus Omnitrophota bacterium]
MIIDTGNVCNLKCPLCPTGAGRPTRQKGFLGYDHFKKTIDEAREYLYSVDLYNWGEPFLNQDIFRMIRYLKASNIKVILNSNLNTLKDEEIISVVESGLDELKVSIDGASPQTYSQYRVNGDFNVVMANLKKLIEARRIHHARCPHIIWQFLIMKHNEHEIQQAKLLAKQIGVDEIEFRPMRTYMGIENLMNDAAKIKAVADWLPVNEQYSRYDYKKLQRKNAGSSCFFLKTTMIINADGSASPCCGVYDEKWDFGNVFKDGVMGVWNNKRYQQARKAVSEKDSSDKTLICSYCIENGFIEY